MKKNVKIMTIIAILCCLLVSCGQIENTLKVDDATENASIQVLTNNLFKIDMPQKFDGMYETMVKDNAILIFDKECKDEGYEALVVGIYAFENPEDWAIGPTNKVGELTLNNGKLYDIVLSYPTESQYGFDRDMPAKYKTLYDARFEIASCVVGLDGEKVEVGKGCKGENLYKEVLGKHMTALDEKWDATTLENNNMSTMYATIANGEGNIYDKVGYVYEDINVDGIEELMIGEIADGDWKGTIYDIYTMVDRKPQHVVSGWDRNRYYVLDSMILNEASGGAGETDYMVYDLVSNSTELFFQYGFKYDEYTDKGNPYFRSYDNNEENRNWESITETDFKEMQDRVSNRKQFDYIPFSKLK